MTTPADLTWRSPDQLTLHARDYPGSRDAAPVICLHGLTRNARDFEDLAPVLAARTGRRVLAVDMRGRGSSDRAPDPQTYNPGVYAADILALLDQQSITRAVFIGTSMGGLIMMMLAAMRPDAIAGAVLNDVGPEIAASGLERIRGYVGVPAAVETWADAAAYVKAGNQSVFPHYDDAAWHRMAHRTFRDVAGRPVLDYDPDIALSIRAADPDAPPPDLWPLFTGLMVGRPALLVRGECSDILDDDIAGRMRLAAPDMAYAVVPGVGHAPMLDEPVALTAILDLISRTA